VKRKILVILLGLFFLGLLTWLGTILTNLTPSTPTPRVQTTHAGPYEVTLQITPDPPLTTRPTTLLLQIVQNGNTVTDAQVLLESSMEDMDMGLGQITARYDGSGLYRAQVQFAMSGPWQLQVVIVRPGAPIASAQFEVTAQ
jgi:hypothetical protein